MKVNYIQKNLIFLINKIIFLGDKADNFYYILRGKVRVYTYHEPN